MILDSLPQTVGEMINLQISLQMMFVAYDKKLKLRKLIEGQTDLIGAAEAADVGFVLKKLVGSGKSHKLNHERTPANHRKYIKVNDNQSLRRTCKYITKVINNEVKKPLDSRRARRRRLKNNLFRIKPCLHMQGDSHYLCGLGVTNRGNLSRLANNAKETFFRSVHIIEKIIHHGIEVPPNIIYLLSVLFLTPLRRRRFQNVLDRIYALGYALMRHFA